MGDYSYTPFQDASQIRDRRVVEGRLYVPGGSVGLAGLLDEMPTFRIEPFQLVSNNYRLDPTISTDQRAGLILAVIELLEDWGYVTIKDGRVEATPRLEAHRREPQPTF